MAKSRNNARFVNKADTNNNEERKGVHVFDMQAIPAYAKTLLRHKVLTRVIMMMMMMMMMKSDTFLLHVACTSTS